MPLVKPIENATVSFVRLVYDFFVSPLITQKLRATRNYETESASASRPETFVLDSDNQSDDDITLPALATLFKSAILQTLPFDTYDPVTNTYTLATGQQLKYTSNKLSLALVLTTVFGLPNRPDKFITEADNTTTPSISLKQALKDWVGGFTPFYTVDESVLLSNTQEEYVPLVDEGNPVHSSKTTIRKRNINAKTLLQIPAIFFKGLVILPIKILTFPLKLLLNVAKFFVQTLPLFFADATALGIGKLVSQIRYKWNQPAEVLVNNPSNPLMNGTTIPNRKGFFIGFRVLLIGLLGIAHYTTRFFFLIARAYTSPELSARQAFFGARGLKITTGSGDSLIEWPRLSNILGLILGSVLALMSFAVSATLWAITFPLAISTISSFIPQVMTLLTSIAEIPAIASFLSTFSGAFGTMTVLVNNTLAAAFGPFITAIASAIPGLVVSAQAIAVGTFLGVVLAPVASILSRVSDTFSNFWAAWNPPEQSLSIALYQEVNFNLKLFTSSKGSYSQHSGQSVQNGDKLSVGADRRPSTPDNPSGWDSQELRVRHGGAGGHSAPPDLSLEDASSDPLTYGGGF